ncbi:MAG: YobA family protein [Oscillospiraceae bacterium]|jgi:hypothetical protein|nr:YobA family protein [Oscillospiraceae bacterium]
MTLITKVFALLLALLMSYFSFAETTEFIMTATLIEIDETGYLALQEDGQEVRILFDENTQFDLLFEVAAGDRIEVTYDGRMTRSLPPQITAQRVAAADPYLVAAGDADDPSCREIVTLIEIDETGYLARQEDGQEMRILFTENTRFELPFAATAGDRIAVIYDGRMTRSLPPQITAQRVAATDYYLGAVRDVDAAVGRVLVETAAQGKLWVMLPEGADAASWLGKGARVYMNGFLALSEPAQATALTLAEAPLEAGIIAELAEGGFLLETAQGVLRVTLAEGVSQEGLAAGQQVQVLMDDAMALAVLPLVDGE